MTVSRGREERGDVEPSGKLSYDRAQQSDGETFSHSFMALDQSQSTGPVAGAMPSAATLIAHDLEIGQVARK